MKKVSFLPIILFVIIFFISFEFASAQTQSTKKPNVVLIIVDTLRADKLGSYGYNYNVSAEIDKIANSGTTFLQAIAQSSWTRPSTGSFLTSQYPRTLGIYKEQWDILPDKFLTLAEALKEQNYQTIGVTANPNINKVFNFHQGFDQYIESKLIFDWMKTEGDKDVLKRKQTLVPAEKIFEQALIATESKNDQPTFLLINIMEVHTTSYKKITSKQIDQDLKSNQDAKYLQSVRNASKQVGAFIEKLSQKKAWQNTLYIIVSDHGEGLSDSPNVKDSQTHGNLLYDSFVHVPLIFYNPSDPKLKSKKIKSQVRLLDLMPTVLDYVGAKIPQDLQGVSLLPLVADQNVNTPANITISETNWRNVDKVAIYSQEMRYIENRDNWKGVNPKELQARTPMANGIKSDQISKEPKLAQEMSDKLLEWEQKNPKHINTEVPVSEASPEELEQLRSLGYLK